MEAAQLRTVVKVKAELNGSQMKKVISINPTSKNAFFSAAPSAIGRMAEQLGAVMGSAFRGRAE